MEALGQKEGDIYICFQWVIESAQKTARKPDWNKNNTKERPKTLGRNVLE